MKNLRVNALGNYSERRLAGLETNDLRGNWDEGTLEAGHCPTFLVLQTRNRQRVYQCLSIKVL